MKKAKITFIPLDGSGALHLDFQKGPFGDAVQAIKGDGVGFFTSRGELQGVTFDDVGESKDKQTLDFDRLRIEVTVKKGQVSYSVTTLDSISSRSPKKDSRPAA